LKLNLLDGIILAIVTFGLWRGFVSGLIRELSQLFGVFVGFAFALQLMRPAGVFMVSVVSVVDMPIEAAALVSFVVIFLVVYLIVFFSSRFLERVADGAKLGPINKFLGAVFGAAKAALVLSITLAFLGQIGLPGKATESASYLHGPVEKIAPEAWEVFSRSVPTATGMTHIVGERFWKKKKDEREPAETELGGPAEEAIKN